MHGIAKAEVNAMKNVVEIIPFSLTPRFSGVEANCGEQKTVLTVFGFEILK
jgi:hypothetical protein